VNPYQSIHPPSNLPDKQQPRVGPGVGFEATQTSEFGNAVNFSSGKSHHLTKVIVTMSGWGCATGGGAMCSTPEDSTFAQPITLNIYSPSTDGVNPSAKIASITNTFNIKYRPSASAECGYDSLNVALTEDPTNVRISTSVVPGKPWLSSTWASNYADGGTASLGTFRIDSPNVAPWWGVNDPLTSAPWYVPAIKVFANQDGKGDTQSDENSAGNQGADNKSDGKHGIKKD
jgi:hypothetical protein